MNSSKLFYLAATAAFTLLLGSTANAALVVVGDFESQPLGDINGQDGWTVNTQASRTASVVSGGLDYDNGTFSFSGGNKSLHIFLPSGLASDPVVDFVSKTFTPQTGGVDNTFYFRYTFSVTGLGSFTQTGFAGDNEVADLFTKESSSVMALRSSDQLRGYQVGGTNVAETSTQIAVDTTYLAIGKVEFNASGDETLSLVINPTSLDEGSNSFVSLSTELGVESFEYFGFYANRNGNDSFDIDNIYVADTWGEITAASSAVPEPATTTVLVGISILGLAIFRKHYGMRK